MRKFLYTLFSVLLIWGAQAKNVLLIVDQNLSSSIEPELIQWKEDAQKKGWTIETYQYNIITGTNLAQKLAEQQIWPRVRTNTNLHIFIVGAVPVARSGLYINPDGHPDTTGAYVSAAYYAAPSTNWTDKGDNTGSWQLPAHKNVPNDGRFDNDTLPAGIKVTAAVGILNFESINYNYWRLSTNETTLQTKTRKYRDYFARLHEYNDIGWDIKTLTAHANGYTSIQWGAFTNWAVTSYGETNFVYFTSVDATKTQPYSIYDKPPFGILYDFKLVSYEGWLWKSISTKVDKRWAVFDLFFGSYNVDMGSDRLLNSLVGCSLATASYTWAGWKLDGFINGNKTLGEVWMQTLNVPNSGFIYRNIYGDPTIVYHKSVLFAPVLKPITE